MTNDHAPRPMPYALRHYLPLFSIAFGLMTPTIAIANSDVTPSSPGSLSVSKGQAKQADEETEGACPPPVLSRLTPHQVAPGETLESIAAQYGLIPATLVRLNPSLQSGALPIGKEILIPPFNGARVEVPQGATWQDLADAYGVRADVLFELNGCQRQPQQVFVPGVNWAGSGQSAVDTYTGFARYPLATAAPVILNYGWQQNPNTGAAQFHSGIDLLAQEGSPVLSVDAGTVAFAGQQGSYGNLVVVNHPGGRQTRYAHLSQVSVRTGQQVQPGATLGRVGSTGNPDSDRSHLHFEVRYNSPQGWVAQDPEIHLK